MEDLIPINITIADRTYRIKTLPANEEAIRKTVKDLNEKIIEFKTNYAGKDIQDYLAMAVIWMATSNLGNIGNDNEEVKEGLEGLRAMLMQQENGL